MCAASFIVVLKPDSVFTREGQTAGFWAWDIESQEMVLVIPAVLAILGDNPMQSEIACHVGLTGKFFCRVCKVFGREASGDRGDEDEDSEAIRGASPTPSAVSEASAVASEGLTEGVKDTSTSKKGKRKETMQELVDRARRFVMVSNSLH